MVLLSEVKSSINNNPRNPKKKLSSNQNCNRNINISGLGIQVKFHGGKSPVEIILKDPDLNIDGSIFGSVYTNIVILESLLNLEKDGIVYMKNSEEARKIVLLFKSILDGENFKALKQLNLSQMIKNNKIFIPENNLLSEFFDLYFKFQENTGKGLKDIFAFK